MSIPNTRLLKDTAARRLGAAREPRKLALIYALGVVLSSLAITAVNYGLSGMISDTGGLSSLGSSAIISTVITLLPIIQTFALLGWDFGYLFTMLRVSREQEVNPAMLPFGFQRFWPLLRLTLLQSVVYLGLALLSMNISMVIFFITPLCRSFMELMVPISEEMSSLSTTAIDLYALDNATLMALYESMIPYFILFAFAYIAMMLPVSYNFRMANYSLLDHPQAGALAALQESRFMMRGNRIALFKLDLGLWWYYLLLAVAALVSYCDILLALLGVALPISTDAATYLFYGVYLLMMLGIYYFARNRVEVIYALAYDAIRPRYEEKSTGVVLGNIFQM